MKVDITDCGFVSQPVVTVTSAGPGKCPSVFVSKFGPSEFMAYTVGEMTANYGKAEKCELHWSAYGYNCQ